MTRLLPLLAILAITAASCANTPLNAGDAASPVETTEAPKTATTTPAAIAFSFGDIPLEILAFNTISEDGGICMAFDAYLDLAFADLPQQHFSTRDKLVNDSSSTIWSISEDSELGSAWQRWATAVLPLDGSGVDPSTIPDAELDLLASEQCGYPVIAAFQAALNPTCVTPIDDAGVKGEPVCTPITDPRP
ncbi:MAG: hypothetical protein V3V01_06090 [Acidimicrobiales bacterium]